MGKYLNAIAFFVMLPTMAAAQSDDTVFDPSNAILDTKIPFAIGAQEGQQSLRASFGWPTFQEGLVMGVYYRFDPDGYARFATSPRLDTDVFEVMCRARTHVCAARKGPLAFRLTDNGQVHMLVDGLVTGTQLAVSDGVNIIALPEAVLQPLSPALENALAAARELIISQDQQTSQNVRLDGLAAVLAYLRWVAAGQDYSVLPSNWPIPADGRLLQRNPNTPANWREGEQDNTLAQLLENAEGNAFAGSDDNQFVARVTPPVPSQILPIATPTVPASATDPALLSAISHIEMVLERMQRQLATSSQGQQNNSEVQIHKIALQVEMLRRRLDLVEQRILSTSAIADATANSNMTDDSVLPMASAHPVAAPETVTVGPLVDIDAEARQRLLTLLGVSSGQTPSDQQPDTAQVDTSVRQTKERPNAETNAMSREEQLLQELAALRAERAASSDASPAPAQPGILAEPENVHVAPSAGTGSAETVQLERKLVEAILDELSAEAAADVPETGTAEPARAQMPTGGSDQSGSNDDGFKSLTDYLRDISPAN